MHLGGAKSPESRKLQRLVQGVVNGLMDGTNHSFYNKADANGYHHDDTGLNDDASHDDAQETGFEIDLNYSKFRVVNDLALVYLKTRI